MQPLALVSIVLLAIFPSPAAALNTARAADSKTLARAAPSAAPKTLARGAPSPLRARPDERMSADGTKKRSDMTSWEIYTDGEYGKAFKFPWESEASELTFIGHALPIAIVSSIYLIPLAYGFANGAFHL